MKFEEALSELRLGKKIRHPMFEKDVYLMACRVGLIGYDPEPPEEKPISIVKMKGDRQHDEISGRACYVGRIKQQLKKILTEEDYKKYHNFYNDMAIAEIFDDAIFQFPQLNLNLVMWDNWEIYEN